MITAAALYTAEVMTEARPGDSGCAILAIVALRGPSTPYDIKRALGHLAAEFWSIPHTQAYSEMARLAEAGLLSVEVERGGRHRRIYTLTPSGTAALQDWLADTSGAGMEIRDAAQLRLFAGELAQPGDIRRLAEAQVGAYRQRLAALDATEARFEGHPELELRMLPARLGRRVYAEALAFWQEVAGDSGR